MQETCMFVPINSKIQGEFKTSKTFASIFLFVLSYFSKKYACVLVKYGFAPSNFDANCSIVK